MAQMSEDLLAALRALDTPTVCNALEVLDEDWRTSGFTTEPLVCTSPELVPMVGYARTATIKAKTRASGTAAEGRDLRIAYYRYVESAPGPTIAVIEDLDGSPGFGAFWGEVQTTVHNALGCLGVVTNGSVRDLDMAAPGFQMLAGSVGPSHAWVHLEAIETDVTVANMSVKSGDLIHADRHGAVVIPDHLAAKVPEMAGLLVRREAVLLARARLPGFNAEAIAEALATADDIH